MACFILFLCTLTLGELVCGSRSNPANFTSRSAMEANGWVFSWESVKDFWPEPTDYYCENVKSTGYCGYCFSYCVGTLSLVLELSGYNNGWLEIDYGNSWINDEVVELYVNGRLSGLIDRAHTFETFNTSFNDGDVLMVQEVGGVAVINDIHFHCTEMEDPSASPSLPPTSAPSAESEIEDPSASPSLPPTSASPAESGRYFRLEMWILLSILIILICLMCLVIKVVYLQITLRKNLKVRETVSTFTGEM